MGKLNLRNGRSIIFDYWLPSLAQSSQTWGNQEKSWIEVAGFAKITGFRIQIGERDRKQKQTDFRGQKLDFWHFHHFQILYFSRKPYPPCHSASYQEVPSLRPPRRHLPELGRITGSSYFFLARFKLEWKEHSVYSNRYGGILTLVQSLIFVHILDQYLGLFLSKRLTEMYLFGRILWFHYIKAH